MRKQDAARDPLENREKLLQAIRAWPAPAVLERKSSVLHGEHVDKGIEMPVAMNGKQASYLLDTGTTASTITPDEASRLGLDVLPVPGFAASDANDEDVPANVVLVKELAIGGFRLSNVLFLVEKDDTGGHGIIGMNVLELLETVSWTGERQIAIGYSSPAFDLATANLCLDKAENPLIDARYQGKPILIFFDSGADDSQFLNRFGAEFPDVKRTGKATEISSHGAGSTHKWRGLKLPQIAIGIGKATVTFADEMLLTDDRPDFHANAHLWLGFDALKPAPRASLDFHAMRFALSQ